jgi:hypothetical protein
MAPARSAFVPDTRVLVSSLWLVLLGACGASGAGARKAGSPPVVPAPSRAAIALAPTPLRFEIDPTTWTEQDVGAFSNPGVVAVKAFSRVKAASDADCPAALVVIAESVPSDMDVIEYSAWKRSGMRPHTVEKVFSHLDGMLQLKSAVGYRIRGTVGCFPVVHLVHARNADVGYTILVEVDPRDYALIEPEIRALVRSFQLAEAVSPGASK